MDMGLAQEQERLIRMDMERQKKELQVKIWPLRILKIYPLAAISNFIAQLYDYIAYGN